MNRRMPNGTYGGVRGKETKVGQKTFVSRPTRFNVSIERWDLLAQQVVEYQPASHRLQ